MRTDLNHLIFFDELQGVPHIVAVQSDLVISFHIHKVEQIPIAVKILHIHTVNTRRRELFCGAEGLLHYTAVNDIFELCPYKSRSFSRFYMLEFQYLINIAFYFQCNAVSEISC